MSNPMPCFVVVVARSNVIKRLSSTVKIYGHFVDVANDGAGRTGVLAYDHGFLQNAPRRIRSGRERE